MKTRLLGRWAGVVCLACVLFIGMNWVQSQQPAHKEKAAAGPEIGFDYRAFVVEHQQLINSGQIEKAVSYLRDHCKNPKLFAPIEESMRKAFSSIYGTAGKQEHLELVGFKRLSSRQYHFFSMAHYENGVIQFQYAFELYQGEWKWVHFGSQAVVDEMVKVIPMQLMSDR